MKLLDFPCNSQRQAIMQIRSDDLYTDRQTIHKADRHGRSRQQWQRGEASPEQLVIVADITVIDTQHTLLARLSLIDRKRRAVRSTVGITKRGSAFAWLSIHSRPGVSNTASLTRASHRDRIPKAVRHIVRSLGISDDSRTRSVSETASTYLAIAGNL